MRRVKRRGLGGGAAWTGRVLAVFMSVVLAAGLMPAQGLAEAVEQLGDSSVARGAEAIEVVDESDSLEIKDGVVAQDLGDNDSLVSGVQGGEGAAAVEDTKTQQPDTPGVSVLDTQADDEGIRVDGVDNEGIESADEAGEDKSGSLLHTQAAEVPYQEGSWDGEKVSWAAKTVSNYTIVTPSTTAWGNGWYVVDGEVHMSDFVKVSGTANLVLKDGSKLTSNVGIEVPEGSVLNVYAQQGGTGSMSVTGPSMMAAIGSRNNENAGEITIHGGKIEAQGTATDGPAGSWGSAGIGSGPGGKAGSVTVYGGAVFATGGKYSAAIGGGANGDGGSVAVYGGRVAAKGGAGAAGIGHGVAANGNSALSDGTLALGSNMAASGGTDNFNTALGTGPRDNVKSRGTYIGICEQVPYREATWDEASGRVSFTSKKTLHYWEPVASLEKETLEHYGSHVLLHDGWYLVEGDVTLSDAFVRVGGTVNLILADNSSFNAQLGVQIAPGSTLNVYSQSDSKYTGVLTAEVATQFNTPNGSVGLAGIGGTISYQVLDTPGMADVTSEDPGALVVYGGRIVASGSANAAGIGGNWGKAGGAVTVYGGEVVATGGSNASGIGGGNKGDGGAVTIYGGEVTATGGSNASGIGGGNEGNGGTVTVYGGEVTTTGNDSPGIGHGNYLYSSCSDGTLSLGEGRAAYGGQDYSTLRATGPCEDVTPRDSWIRITDELSTGFVRYQEASWEKTFVKYTFKTATRWVPVSANTTTWRDGWYVVDGNIVAENTINVYGTANLILKDGSKLTANRGIRVEEGSTLNVYAQIGGTGALVAKGYSEWTWNSSDGSTSISNGVAAIGASCNSYRSAKAGSVVIHGGKVTAEGDYETAGIGGSVGGSGGEVTIYGGEVTATGGSWAAGIGGGCEGDGGSVEIYGGTVVATGGSPEVAGIGKGSGGSHDGTVSLKDTNLEMRGGSDYTLPLGSGPCDNIESRDCHMRVVKTFHGDGIVSFVESSWDGTKVVKTAKETDSWDRVSPEVTSWSGGVWYVVVESDVYVNERIMVSGTVNLVLGDGVKLTAPQGINLPSGSTLNIYAQQEGTGELVVERFGESVAGAGIGGDNGQSGGSLVVHGGVVKVTGNQADQYGAGIGGGYMGAGGHVVVYDGTVEATGNPCGAGIGGGCFGAGGETVVYGGTVKGTCLYEAAGIGGGKSGDGGSLTVYGGTVEAMGGTYSAGIGGGYRGSGGVVAIHDGKTSSTGGDYGSGVGGGYCGTCGEVNVYGGSLTATGGYYGAGIGSGIMGDEDNENLGCGVTISGGEVVATGGPSAAGIGGGALGSGAVVTITGGSVTAKGSSYAAGIGGGERGSGAAVTIEGGNIDAEGGKCAAGIGGGYMGAGGDVTVSGGSVIALGGNAGIGRGYEATENGVLSIADGLYVYGGEQRSSLLGTGPCENVEARKLFMSINGTIELALAKVEVAPGPYVYTGSQVTPPVTVEFGGVEVPASSYDVSYGENVHAGEGAGSVTVTAKEGAACAGSKTATFNIGKASNEIVGLAVENWTYGEAAHTPTATAAGEPVFTYADSENGEWSSNVPTSAGQHWVKAEVAATNDYDGATATAQFTIAKASISPSVSVAGWNYGLRTSDNEPVISGNTGNGVVRYEYKSKNAADDAYSTDVPSIPGTYTVRATVAETNNYLGGSCTADFEIQSNGEGVPYRAASWNEETREIDWNDTIATYCAPVNENATSWGDGLWYVVEGDVVVNSRITVSGTVNLILKDGATLEANKGITVSSGNTLNVYAQSDGADTGKLVAKSAGSSLGASFGKDAAIGGVVLSDNGGSQASAGSLNVYGGVVTASNSEANVAIGGAQFGTNGSFGDGGSITLYGGAVSAESEESIAIGSADSSSAAGSVTVYDGSLTAEGTQGISGKVVTVTVYNGTLTATGTSGPGIVCTKTVRLDSSVYSTVTVYGGSVKATSSDASSPGIGPLGSSSVKIGIVAVHGGEVYAVGGENAFGIGGTKEHHVALELDAGLWAYGGEGRTSLLGAGESSNVTKRDRVIDICATAELPLADITLPNSPYTYTGLQIAPPVSEVAVTLGGVEIPASAYDVSYGENVHAGEGAGSVTVTAKEGTACSGAKTAAFNIGKANNEIVNLAIEGWTYGEQANTPAATVKAGEPVFTYADTQDGPWSPDVPTSAGNHWVKAEVAATDDYDGATATAQFTIAKASNEIVDLAVEGWTYGEQANTPTATVKAGEPVFTYADSENGPWSPDVPTSAGEHWVRAEVAATDDYDGATATAQFTIAKASNEIVVLSVGSWTYGDEVVAPKVEAKYGSPTLTYAAYYDGDNNPKWSPDVPASAGEHWVKAEIAATDDYEGVTATARFTVLPKKLVVGNVTVANKAYDGTASAVITSKGALVGVVDGDDIHLDDAGATAWFENGDVGEDKNVFLSGYWLTGGSQHNYTLEQPTAKATIEKCKVSVGGIAAESKTYDGTVETTVDPSKAVIVDLNGKIVAGDVRASVQDNKGEFDSKDAGMRKAVSCSVALEGADASSYVLDDSNGQVVARANILPLTAKLAWTDTQHTYDGEEHVPAASVTNKVGEDDVTVEVTGGQTDAGDYTATAARFGGADGGNYSLPKDGGATQAFSIARATITPSVSIEGWILNQRTNDSAPVVTGNPGDGNVTYEYKEKAAEDTAYKQYDDDELNALAAGDYTVRATIAETTNYNGGVATSDFEVWDIFGTQSLTLSGTIGLNYFMDLSRLTDAERESCHMTFTLHGRTIKDTFDPIFKNDKGYYGFTCPVRSIEMAEDVEATFSWGEGNSVKRVGKVTDYFSAFEKVASQYDEVTCALVHSIADYGHYVQPFLARANGWVVGDKYAAISCAYDWTKNTDDMWTGTEAEAAEEGTAGHTVTCEKTDGCGVNTITKSLVLDTGTDLRIYFACDEGVSLTSAKLADGATLPVEQAQDGRWIVTVRNISAHLMSATQDITVKTSTDGTVKVRLSALSWVYSALTYEPWKNDETARNAAASIWRYAKAAEKYRSEHS